MAAAVGGADLGLGNTILKSRRRTTLPDSTGTVKLGQPVWLSNLLASPLVRGPAAGGTTRARCKRELAAAMSHSPIDYMSIIYLL